MAVKVTKGERKDNTKGPWLVLTYEKENGETKTANVFEKEVIEGFKGPGTYEFEWTKKGQYYNITKIECLSASKEEKAPESSSNGTAAAPKVSAAATAPAAGVGRVEAALRCLEQATQLVTALVVRGDYKDVDMDTASGDVVVTARRYMEFVAGQANGAAATKKETATKTPEGA